MLLKYKYYSKSNKVLWYRPILWSAYTTLIVVVHVVYGVNLSIPIAIPAILGTAISLFLGFRTNSAYQRWWEARKVWGEIVNNSRSFARQILTFGSGETINDGKIKIINRQIVWCWSLAHTLRNVNQPQEAEKYLSKEEFIDLSERDHIPNLLLLNQEFDLKTLVANGEINDFDLRTIDETLKGLTDSMGKCERIKKTVFPTQYSLFTLVFINIFLFLLPLGMVESLGYFAIPIHIAIGFTFGMIQSIAEAMQDPFENKPNDTPIYAISRGIERNLLEMMGSEDIPKALEAKDGVLM